MEIKSPGKPKSNRRLQQKKEIPANDYDALFKNISGLVKSLKALNQRAVKEYSPVVEGIIRSRSRDCPHIEHTLDSLLGFCGYDPEVELFRKLCRYYYFIDPAGAAFYVNAYFEQWNTEDQVENIETEPKTTKEKILALLKTQPSITHRELADKVGISSHGVNYHLKNLKVSGIIRYVGATRVGYWEVLK